MKYAAGLVIAVALAVLGYTVWYEINDPGHGTVTGKSYTPPSADESCETYKTATGSKRTCTTRVTGECYEITYTDGKHNGDACVTPIEYDRLHVGDTYHGKDGGPR